MTIRKESFFDFENLDTENLKLEYICRIKDNYSFLSKTQRKIAKYICAHSSEALYSSITLLANKIGTTTCSITRFCQALGYKGYGELKFHMEKSLVLPIIEMDSINGNDPTTTIIQKLQYAQTQAISKTMSLLNATTVEKAAAAILSSKNLHIYSSGNNVSAMYMQYLLYLSGYPCQAFNGHSYMEIGASSLSSGDIVIGITFSGESLDVINSIKIAKQRGARIIAITSVPNSTIAKLSNFLLCYSYDIQDNFQYFHIAKICEFAVIGVLQNKIISQDLNKDFIANYKKVVHTINTNRKK